jgi:ABC-2 type transport system ATP-binding protein
VTTGSFAVRTKGLAKRYGDHGALRGVDLQVEHGSVYGLVGPNGAGKTTLLSILAGLRRATAGTIELGVDRSAVAVVSDTPQFEPWLTAREVVALAANLAPGHVPASRVEAALARAGLDEAADRRVGGFSRGMLQRLGLAAATVSAPQLLILDEPSSALDPAGRREILDFVNAARNATTVLFSSHILADVQEVCDTVGILRDGQLLFQGQLEDLLVGRAAPSYSVRLHGDAAAVADRLRREPWVTGVEPAAHDELWVRVTGLEAAQRNLPGALAAAGARVVSIAPQHSSLERIFLELTQ